MTLPAAGYPPPVLEREELIAYWQSHGIDPDRCHYTGWPLGGAFEADHLTPVARGGRNTAENIVPCLPAVKQAKGHRTAQEFLVYLGSRGPRIGVAV